MPLVIVLDGNDYLRRVHLTTIADNLIAQGRVAAFSMALVQNKSRTRVLEYSCSDATAGYIIDDILPLARKQIAAEPSHVGVLGPSLGGLMAMYLGLRFPDVFSFVLSQSGAFVLRQLYPSTVLETLIRYGPIPKTRFWMDVGRYEHLLEPNRFTRDVLLERGFDVNYREYSGGHNWTSWSSDVVLGLEEMVPPESQA